MSDFLTQILAFPTVVYTVLLALILLYWMFVIVGAADIDLFDLDGAADGFLDGAAEALDGAAEALDGAGEALDGAGEALEGAVDGADGAADASESGLAKLLALLRLRRVPLTISISFITLLSWMGSGIGMQVATLYASGLPPLLVGCVVGSLAFIVGVMLTSVLVRPLEPVFETHEGPTKADFVGKVCTVQTSRVDAQLGQGELRDGGDILVFQIRCDHENSLTHGDQTLLAYYDKDRNAYIVEPLAPGSA